MQSGRDGDPGSSADSPEAPWRDRKKYLRPLGLLAPMMVAISWLAVKATGLEVFWWTGPILTFGIVPLLDYFIGPDNDNPPEHALADLDRDRFYRWTLSLYLPAQYLALVLACWLWSGGGSVQLDLFGQLGLIATLGGVGGISINAAHELGHGRGGHDGWLAKLALAQSGYGHFLIEHNRGHHARVATPEDPATARLGQSLYSFVPRSVVGGIRSAWQIDSSRFARRGTSRWTLRSDVINAWLISIVLFVSLCLWFGTEVAPLLIGQAAVAIFMMETANYLEHYGLMRRKRPDGRYERVRPSHSWNSNTVCSNLLLFHLQRHSDHHANPHRRYQTLRHREEAPQLPAGYPAMILLALIPPLWRRVMDPRIREHNCPIGSPG